MRDHRDNTVTIMVLAVILALILVGGALAIVIVNNNMTRQSKEALQAAEELKKDEEARKARDESDGRNTLRSLCIGQADKAYWEYMKLNATSTKETDNGPVYFAPNMVWDTAANNKKTATDECYRQYPNV